jgi:hypothetical protein
MPRVSLPSTLKSLKTYEVLVTQTNESELRLHFESLYAIFELKKDKYMNRIRDAVGLFLDENPYAGKDWKKHQPTRHYKEIFTWFGEDENELQEYHSFSQFYSDVILMHKHFEWDCLEEMKYDLERFKIYMTTGQEDLAKLESMRFNQAKQKFEEENSEWIKEQSEIRTHKNNHLSAYQLRIKKEEGENIDEYLNCKFCKSEYEREVETIKRMREYENSKKESDPNPDPNCEVVEVVQYVKPPVKTCEDCGFKSSYNSTFEAHKNEAYHKRVVQLKEWYCKDCEVQSRTEIEYKNHIQTKKHEKKINGITEFFCEKCNYKTLLKHLFDQHIATKKHLENADPT